MIYAYLKFDIYLADNHLADNKNDIKQFIYTICYIIE